MTTLEDFNKGLIHALLVGYPKSGKTGSIAALANSGYCIWLLDFDRNPDPLIEFVKPEFKKNVRIAQFWDEMEMKKLSVAQGGKTILMEKFMPKHPDSLAYSRAVKQINLWAENLGENDIVVLDSLTRLGDVCKIHLLSMLNRLTTGMRLKDWGTVQDIQLDFLRGLRSDCWNCHLLVIAHLKVVEPKHLTSLLEDADNNKLEEGLKTIMEKTTSMVPTKLYPSALGRQLPQDVGSHFPYILHYMNKEGIGGKVSRIISTEQTALFDVAVPLKDVKKEYPIESGLKDIFELARK